MIVIGKLGRPHGILGWLKLISFTDPMENIFQYGDWCIERQGQWQPIAYEDYEIRSKLLLIKFADCNNPEQASRYTNAPLAITREQLPTLAKDEYYWTDLEGLTVINTEGTILGKIDHLLATGANDVMVVIGEKEILIPYISSVVSSVDLQQGQIIVAWDL